MRPAVPLTALLLAALPLAATADDVPTELGQCVATSIAELTNRFEGEPDSGDAVVYANGILGVSYNKVPGLQHARVGDAVELCLTFLPEDCPPGDERGKWYTATNQRTGESWELADAEHLCGGA